MLILFFIWSNFLTHGEKTETKESLAEILGIALLVNSLIIALQEMLQVCNSGLLVYFADVYNYLELTPLITIPVTVIFYLKEPIFKDLFPWLVPQKFRALTQVISALTLWLNFMKFLRPFK